MAAANCVVLEKTMSIVIAPLVYGHRSLGLDLVIHFETVHRSVAALGILAPFIRVLDVALGHADFPFLLMSMSLTLRHGTNDV